MILTDLHTALRLLSHDQIKTLAMFNQCTFGIQKFSGQRHWERHPEGDEFVYAIEGSFFLDYIDQDREDKITIDEGKTIIVPKGIWHRATSERGVTVLFMTPEGDMETSTASRPPL